MLEALSTLSPLIATQVIRDLSINERRALIGARSLTPEEIALLAPANPDTAI
jgi:hypothetical protein